MTPRLELGSLDDIRPVVERSRIVLLDKGLPHEVRLTELPDKPAGSLEVSPSGRVPAVLLDGRPVFERPSVARAAPRGLDAKARRFHAARAERSAR